MKKDFENNPSFCHYEVDKRNTQKKQQQQNTIIQDIFSEESN